MRFRADDGYELEGTLYMAAAGPTQGNAALFHCGAGIPAWRYERFALFLAGHGIPTLTYDYRGIGRSRPRALRGFTATLEDWAEYDSTAAVAWLRERFPKAHLIGMAHSIGALLVGGARNAAELSLLVLIGAHTGYYGDYAKRYRLPMTVLWHAFMPVVTRALGYFPARRLGLGEDLPGKFALQWAARRSPQLWPIGTDAGSTRRRMLLERCAALQRPALVVSISDDAFATPAGIARLMSCYPALSPLWQLHFTPADAGVRRIGHFGFFTRNAGAPLWPRLLGQLRRGPQ